jgi:hypothetical protein
MKELFSISTGRGDPGKEKLSLRMGEKHCSYAVTDMSGNELFELAYCSVESLNENDLSALRSAYPRIAAPYSQVQITFDNSKALLVPSWCYQPEEARRLLRTVYGDMYGCDVLAEPVIAWQMYTVYGVPMDIQDWLNQQYPVKTSRHQYTLLLKTIPALPEGCLFVDLRPTEFIVMAGKGSQLLSAQTYEYSVPADILFRLLQICKSFDLQQDEVLIRVSGLIEEESALYRELSLYFLKLEFRRSAWTLGDTHYPPQFFTALNDLAVCAS